MFRTTFALVALSPWVIQRHAHHWRDPHGFCPERFLAETATTQDRLGAKELMTRIDVDEHVEREPRRARRRGEFRGVPGIVDH